MTDISSVKAHADPPPAPVALYGGLPPPPPPPPPPFTNGSPTLDGTIDEESSTIKCICGFPDDDGNTVLCEKCDTWQHIVCYYPSHQVPDVHECADCLPRDVDSKGATEKQRQHRELHSHNLGERSRGRPKTTAKSHKKRVKDSIGSIQANGWAVHANSDLQHNPERKSGSPRDQPPPTKRPKTSHRPTASVNNMMSQAPTLVPGSRKRGGSIMFNGHSPVKSPTTPDGPVEEFSVEFMHLYRQSQPPAAASNSYTHIGVANNIGAWLNDPEALAQATGGKSPQEVFGRLPEPLSVMEERFAPAISKQVEEDTKITAHGLHPQWQYLTVDGPVAPQGYIGELNGEIGMREEYFTEPSNRWELLRHPEPFVFFPPFLPIYIDTRREGSILRYARRSCRPNMTMKIFTETSEGGTHFCFLATRQIDPGEELTVGWDIDSEVQKQLEHVITNGDIKKEGFKKIQPWVSCVLANFGGCFCDPSPGHECLFERARRNNSVVSDLAQPTKTNKGKKSKKSQVSPLSTGHATNSRAGSEALNRDANEEDNPDTRSTSGSHKSSSRDITPATHFSVDGGDLKMSDRERRKLQQQERLFEQLEYDEQHKGKGRKRNSAGSTLNTPGFSSSKQLGHSEPSPSVPNYREHSNGVARKPSGGSTKMNGRGAHKPKPIYTDTSTQTDESISGPLTSTLAANVKSMKPPMSFKRRLLHQAQQDKIQRERTRSASVKKEVGSPALKDLSTRASPIIRTESSPMGIINEDPPVASPKQSFSMDVCPAEIKSNDRTSGQAASPIRSGDIEMKEAEEETSPKLPEPKVEEMPDAPNSDPFEETSNPPAQPPLPPWPPSSPSKPESEQVIAIANVKPVDLHVELPKADAANITTPSNSAVTPGSVSSGHTGSTIAQSPISTVPVLSPFSPSVTSAINPGPTRKKLSLSEFTKRKQAQGKTQTQLQSQLQGQNASANSMPSTLCTQSTGSPTLSTASLPRTASPSNKNAEPTLPPVTEEPKPLASSTGSTSNSA